MDNKVITQPITIQLNKSRCWKCQKKVGLLGFECSCKYVFCSKCRHAESHQCSFNYMKSGKDMLIKQNPVVIADKMEYI